MELTPAVITCFIGFLKYQNSHKDNLSERLQILTDRIENFSDPHERKEVLLDKFIGKIDKELTDILHKYPLPVIVVGPEKMNGHFKKHTHNEHDILKFIHGNYDHAKPHQLIHLIQPHLAELKKIEHIELASIISHASDSNKISWGIKDVWQNVMKGIGKLLLVEKSYTYRRESAERQGDLLTNGAEKHGEFIRDGIDILIEEVLNSGGEVRFVDHDVFPSDYKIALIHYYSQKSYLFHAGRDVLNMASIFRQKIVRGQKKGM